MSDTKHILVVDDEIKICELLKEYLSAEHYCVSACQSGDAMRRIVEQSTIDIVLLDRILPDDDGLALAGWLRARQPKIGVIILTGRGDMIDRIVGLEMGADDYVAKPFHLRELLARIRSVVRRIERRREGPVPADRRHVRFAGWSLDLAAHALFSPTGDNVPLTGGEFDLIAAFVTHPNQVLTRDRLLDLVCDREGGVFDRTIDVRVGRLRRKLNDGPAQPRLIKTVRGGGYIFTAPVEAAERPSSTTTSPPPAVAARQGSQPPQPTCWLPGQGSARRTRFVMK